MGKKKDEVAVKQPTREDMCAFLDSGLAVMNSTDTRDMLRDPQIPLPGDKLKDLQRAGWEPLGFDPDLGCAALEKVDEAVDKELAEKKQEFLLTSMRVYLRALEDRKPQGRLDNTRKIPREVLFEFFNACNIKMQLPDFQEKIAKFVMENRSSPGPVIIEAQREMLETLGFEADHGCEMLSKIQQDFPNDADLNSKFRQWAQIATNIGNMVASGVMKQQMDPEMMAAVAKAREEVEKLSVEEQNEIVTKCSKKVEILVKLPPKDQEAYLKKLPTDVKDEMFRAQIIITNMKMKQIREKQASDGEDADAATGGSGAKSKANKPSQQMMM